MKLKNAFLAALATLIAWGMGGCAPPTPEHGVAFVLALETNELANLESVSSFQIVEERTF